MGSLIDVLDRISEKVQSDDSPGLFRAMEEALWESGLKRSRVIVFIPRKKAFQTVDGSPVFTSGEFLSLFENLAYLGNPFIVGGNIYYPLVAHDTVAGCIMCPVEDISSISDSDRDTIEKLATIYMLFATSGVKHATGIDSETMLFNNRNVIFGEIAGGVLHDLNNIIGAVLGRAQLGKFKYQKSSDPAILHESLDIIENIALTGGKITQRLRNFARISEALNPKEIRICEIFDSALSMIEHKIMDIRDNKGVEFKIDNLIDRQVQITTDPVLLEEVMFNLIDAGMLLLSSGGQIEATAERDPFNAQVTLRLYGRTASIVKIESELKVVKNLLSIQGGVLDASDQGRFRITIPQASLSTHENSSDTVRIDFRGLRSEQNVLIVEDNDGMRRVLEEILDGLGCSVQSTASAGEAMEKFTQESFDVIFTDIGLPDLDGAELAARIKNRNPNIRVAAITGWHDRVDPVFDSTITKPFNIDEIHKFLEQERGILLFRGGTSWR